MQDPLVSVIVPVYNVEEYLEDCVKSITKQTYKNLEIILVDDGSTDNSSYICDKLSRSDRRILVIHKENGGLSDARNAGLEICHGEYIAFVDSDDMVNSSFIASLYNLISSGNFQVSQVGTQYIDNVGKKLPEKFSYGTGNTILNKEQFIEGLLINKITWAAWCNLYRKDFFKDIRFTKGQYNEDCLMWLDGVEKVNRIIISNQCLYQYRMREGSITAGTNIKFFADEYAHSVQWLDKVKRQYPELTEAAYNELLSDLLIYMRALGNNKVERKYIAYYRKNIGKVLKNRYLPKKRKIMISGICILPNVSLSLLHRLFLFKRY